MICIPNGIPITWLKILLPYLKEQLPSKYFNVFLSEDFVKVTTNLFQLDSTHLAKYSLIEMHFLSTHVKSISPLSSLISLLYRILLKSVEKSKYGIDEALVLLLRLMTELTTGLLLKIVKKIIPEKKQLCLLQFYLFEE